MIPSYRRDYERDVRSLRGVADSLLADGVDEEIVARTLVASGNTLKTKYRSFDDPAIVAIIESRNWQKYGDPVGPDADALFSKYGSWLSVIDAACRPARLAAP